MDAIFTAVVGTRNNIEWVDLYLTTLYETAFDKNIKVIIFDKSSDENYQKLISVCEPWKDKVEIIQTTEDIHHLQETINAVAQVKTKYVLQTHIDIVFLRDGWDQIVLDEISKPNIALFGTGFSRPIYSCLFKDSMAVKTDFMFAEPQLFIDSQYEHFYWRDNKTLEILDVEHGYLTIEMMKRGLGHLLYGRRIDCFGHIFWYNGKEFIYHCEYSSRLHPCSTNPAPEHEIQSVKVREMCIDQQPQLLLKWFREYRPTGVPLEDFIKAEFPRSA